MRQRSDTAMIFDIQRTSFVDGPGIRTAVFFKGCNLKCRWCHNPEGQSFEKQLMFYENKCTGCGKCASVCPKNGEKCLLCGKCAEVCLAGARKICGSEYTRGELYDIILRDAPYYQTTGGGVTFSGGECMLQADFLRGLAESCRSGGINTAVDTAACVPYEAFELIAPFTDLFLFDIKCMDTVKHKKYTGEGNELILSNIEGIARRGNKYWIRVPVIPGVNDSDADILEIARFIVSLSPALPEKIELLPYHRLGEGKYSALGLKLPDEYAIPSEEEMRRLNRLLIENLPV